MEVDAPLALHADTARDEWMDYNGHMNVAYYVLVFDHATDALLDFVGMDGAYRRRTLCSNYILEGHITYDQELRAGDRLRVTTQLLAYDAKRLHYFHHMYHASRGFLAATNELISLHVDTTQTRGTPMPAEVLTRLERIVASHRRLPTPVQVGRAIGIGGGDKREVVNKTAPGGERRGG
jgi:acyl-CoA thioester hydrolase